MLTPSPFCIYVCVWVRMCVCACVYVRVRVCLVWTSFCQPLAFTFFLACPGQTKCEILPSAELSKVSWGLAGDECGICLSLELPQGSAGKAVVLRC